MLAGEALLQVTLAFDPEVNYQAPVEPIAGGNFCKASDTAPPVSPVHHYQLSYNSPALTCSAADIEVTACANASCSELYEGSSTVQLNSTAGDWSTNPVSASPVGSTSPSRLMQALILLPLKLQEPYRSRRTRYAV